MLVRSLQEREQFVAGDKTHLREVLHPARERLSIRYSLAHAVVHPGEESLPHRLEASEVYYILAGEGVMYIDGESAPVQPGDVAYVPPSAVQHIRNTGLGDLEFLCIVDPAWRTEDEEVYQAGGPV